MSEDDPLAAAPSGQPPETEQQLADRQVGIDRFMNAPAAYVHDDWFDDMEHGTLLRRLRENGRTREHVSHELLTRLDLDIAGSGELDDPRVSALCLAEPAGLHELVRYAGLVAGSQSLRQVMDGRTVHRIREAIGAEAYRFAIDRVEFLAPEAMLDEFPPLDLDDLPRAVDCHGMRLVGSFCQDLPVGLTRRLMLKLPARWAAPFSRPFNLETQDNVPVLFERLMRELKLV